MSKKQSLFLLILATVGLVGVILISYATHKAHERNFDTDRAWISNGDIVIITNEPDALSPYADFHEGIYFAKIIVDSEGTPVTFRLTTGLKEDTWDSKTEVPFDKNRDFRKYVSIERLIAFDKPEYHTYLRVQAAKQKTASTTPRPEMTKLLEKEQSVIAGPPAPAEMAR